MRWGLFFGVATAFGIAAIGACDSTTDSDAPTRYYVAPDANDDDGSVSSNDGSSSGASDVTVTNKDATTSDAPNVGGIDPATLPLTGWWQASYTTSPWVGATSAGTSKGHDLSEVTNPPIASTPINGFAPAGFDGTKSVLGSTVPVNMYLSATGWEVAGLFSADSAKPYVVGAPYNFPAFVTDNSGGDFYVAFSSAGVIAGHWDTTVFHEIVSPCPTGGLHAFQAWFDGTKLNLMIDGGAAAVPVVTGPPTFGPGLLRVGSNYASAGFFDGRIVEIMMAAKALAPDERSGIRAYFNKRYGTAFPL